jgi:glycosyltransferase involved in cell wall biosynthesis
MSAQYKIKTLYLNFFTDKLISYVCLRLIKYFNNRDVLADLMGISSDRSVESYRNIQIEDHGRVSGKLTLRKMYQDAFPQILFPVARRFLSNNQINAIAEWRFFRQIEPGDVVYLFPGASVALYKRLKNIGCYIVTERINTLRCHSKIILDAEYTRLGMNTWHDISDASTVEELRELQLADYIFAPSPTVATSLEKGGIHAGKILATSYGMDADDILDVTCRSYDSQAITVIFVGSICVRKGAHLLLDAWKKAKINGKLIFVGNIEHGLRDLFAQHLDDQTIFHIPFVDDLRPIYRQADLFVLPSLEEGSPLVTYLALGASLPMVVSSMGAGGIVQDGKEALVIDPFNQQQFVGALRRMAESPNLRADMGRESGRTATKYTWNKVAKRRILMLIDKLKQPDVHA